MSFLQYYKNYIFDVTMTTYNICINVNKCQYGCQKFSKDLNNPTLSSKMVSILIVSLKNAKNVISQFANKLHRLAQESVIAFPRSASTVNNSPRFQEFLRIAVENVVVGSVHELGAISKNCFQKCSEVKHVNV